MATITLKQGDVIEQLKTLNDESVDAIITDPPYNLSFMGKKWDSKGGPLGFQQWCAEWGSECLRVLRKGGFIFSFGGTRTYHRMTSGLEDAGFIIKDCFSWNYGSGFPKSQNTAKAIDKKLGVEPTILGRNPNSREKSDKDNTLFESGTVGKTAYITEPTSELAQRWKGYGSASIKPAWEPIILAQKPFKGTIINNVIENGVGVVNIDACRISHNEPVKTTQRKGRDSAGVFDSDACGYDNSKNTMASASPSGRFPANVLLSHHPSCVRVGEKSIKNNSGSVSGNEPSHAGNENANCYGEYQRIPSPKYGDDKGYEIIEDWVCEPNCPIDMMNTQSGDTSSTRIGNPKDAIKKVGNKLFGGVEQKEQSVSHDYRDSGGASRFFHQPQWDCHDDCPIHLLDKQAPKVGNLYQAKRTVPDKGGSGLSWTNGGKATGTANDPTGVFDGLGGASRFFYHAKVSKRERTCNGEVDNKHPTLKPIALMEYLIKFACPTADAMGRQPVIMDCFLGSGSTAVAANRLNVDCIGIEYREEALETAYNRLIHDEKLKDGAQAPCFEGWKPHNTE
jgi:DNA modification methylase